MESCVWQVLAGKVKGRVRWAPRLHQQTPSNRAKSVPEATFIVDSEGSSTAFCQPAGRWVFTEHRQWDLGGGAEDCFPRELARARTLAKEPCPSEALRPPSGGGAAQGASMVLEP